jgi:hypothetical protein
LCVAVCLLVGGVSVVAARWRSYTRSPITILANRTPEDEVNEDETDEWATLDVLGVCRPSLIAASQTEVAESSKVIGVVVNGQARAYLMSAMGIPGDALSEESEVDLEWYLKRHVVNDVIADSPVSITYCDLSQCVRVLTSQGQQQPLRLRIGGISEGKMLLLYEGQRYEQSDDAIPLQDVSFTVTSWGQWKNEHTLTLVYTGTP